MTLRLRLMRRRTLAGLAAVVATTAAIAYGVSCPIDSSSAYFTGETRVDRATGKLLKLYKCARGHEFWSTR